MTETYAQRMKHKAERLAQIGAELDALHSQAVELLGGAPDPREDTVLAQLGAARRGVADYLPTAQAAAGEAAGGDSHAADYLNRKYGPAEAGRQGGTP